ncbi:MAG: amidohydrolase [Robiginitomaculum sp.]|nr:MAG: amidohydrolase [Robiginitomaculum sp.]
MKYQITLISALILFVGLSACTPKQQIDRIITGGIIHSGVEDAPLAEAIVVDQGRILYVGDAKGAKHFSATTVTDLKGAHLFPGFTDAHAHLFGIGEREISLNLENTKSLADLLDAVKQKVTTQKTGTIMGRGWIETHWPEGRFLNRFDLEAVAPGRIVLLTRADGHALVASTPALEAVGINADSIDPAGGRIERDGEGAPSGMLVDNAMALVIPLIDNLAGQDRRPILAAGADVMAAYGWTGMHNMSVGRDDVLLLEDMAKKGNLPIRVYNGLNREAVDLLQDGLRFAGDHRVITRAIKLYMDGALGSRGAALLAPYSDDPEQSGLMLSTKELTIPILSEALRRGWQLQIHAIGDRGNRETLDWMEQTMAEIPADQRKIADPRWRIEHAQMLDPSDIARFAELGVIPSMQPSHAIGDLYFAKDRVGADRLEGAYAWQSLIDAGSIIPGGSDAPVERGDPRIEFYAAISRAALNGFTDEHWHEEEAVSREDALKMFTLWPAFASFREDELGTIEVGKRADFTVFDLDLMTVEPKEILTAKVLWTIVDGIDAYSAKTQETSE